jgi:glycosyltransferase involved in cell wall biosynthesis
MQKVLFISDGSPFSFSHSGASSFKTSHLALLNEIKTLCIYIVRFPSAESAKIEISDLDDSRFIVIHADFATVSTPPSLYKSVLKVFSKPGRFSIYTLLFHSITKRNLSVIQNIVNDIKPDIIWAEHLEPFLLTGLLHQFQGKIIYSHHDFLWKLVLIRRQLRKDRIRAFLLQWIQKDAIRKNGNYVVGGAQNELNEVSAINKRSSTLYIPTLYPIIPVSFPQNPFANLPLRIVHFGSPQATANRIGLKNLLTHIIPQLQNKIDFECLIVGHPDKNNPELNRLLDQPNIICTGYVADLRSVLRPLDIHILPYDQPTGSRTRYAVAINHGQLLVAHRACVTGIEGLIHQENCLLENSFPEIADRIIALHNSPQDRLIIATNAKKWYDKTHTRKHQATILKTWLSQNGMINE